MTQKLPKKLDHNKVQQGITSLDQCIRIQERRVEAQKPGYSKAVRKFVKAHGYHLDFLPVYEGARASKIDEMLYKSRISRAKGLDKLRVFLEHHQ